ncbi:hypothetical protein PG993_010492 [Apiospora rasikravindrae]|uniref:Uncharacterized protein n=1 Tax=Apiospora rasikravindrae TaxID=990691 RepID=A0ABR1SMQ0_9PEZI
MYSSSVSVVSAAIFTQAIHAATSGIQGRDFGFNVVYPSGLTVSTSKPPADVLSLPDVLYDVPQITFSDKAAASASSSEKDAPQYLSFLELSYVPWSESLGDAIYTFPWIQANGTVSPANGTLLGSELGWRRPDKVETGEVRNASLHVWRQTPELLEYLFGAGNTLRMPLFWQVAGVWAHSTSKVDYDFKFANIDFKVRNETGKARCNVDSHGASITGVTSTACASTAAPTVATATSDHSVAPTGVAAEPTGSAESPASTPNAAACWYAVPSSWLATSFVLILGII